MKISEAKQIIWTITKWQFYMQGIVDEIPCESLSTDLSLEDLMRANKMVSVANKRKMKDQNDGKRKKGISIQLTIDERLIAAIYVALHYPANGEAVAIMNMIGVGCVKMKA